MHRPYAVSTWLDHFEDLDFRTPLNFKANSRWVTISPHKFPIQLEVVMIWSDMYKWSSSEAWGEGPVIEISRNFTPTIFKTLFARPSNNKEHRRTVGRGETKVRQSGNLVTFIFWTFFNVLSEDFTLKNATEKYFFLKCILSVLVVFLKPGNCF